MNHIKALAERWLTDAHNLEMEAIQAELGSLTELRLKMNANQFRLRACELEIAMQMDDLVAFAGSPIFEQTPSRS